MADELDARRLRELYESDPVARAILTQAARRLRNRRETTVDRTKYSLAQEGHEVSRVSIVRVFQALQDIGCGCFVVGRRGRASRFEWSTSIVEVGRAAVDHGPQRGPGNSVPPPGVWVKHTYDLRPETPIDIFLPLNLTADEGQGLAGFIQTLPLGSEV